VGDRGEGIVVLQRKEKLIGRNMGQLPIRANVAERHGFDDRQIMIVSRAIFDHRQQVGLVEIAQCDHVDLDPNTRFFRRFYPIENDLHIGAASNLGKTVGVERVHADIDPPHAMGGKMVSIFA